MPNSIDLPTCDAKERKIRLYGNRAKKIILNIYLKATVTSSWPFPVSYRRCTDRRCDSRNHPFSNFFTASSEITQKKHFFVHKIGIIQAIFACFLPNKGAWWRSIDWKVWNPSKSLLDRIQFQSKWTVNNQSAHTFSRFRALSTTKMWIVSQMKTSKALKVKNKCSYYVSSLHLILQVDYL